MPERAVILGGWGHPVASLAPLRNALQGAGFSVHTLSADQMFADSAAAPLDQARAAVSDAAPDVLLGWSLGGMIALQWIAEEKGLPAVVIASGAAFCRAPDYKAGLPRRELRGLQRAFRRNPEAAMASFIALCAEPHPPPASGEGQSDNSEKNAARERGLAYLDETDLRPILPRIRGPVAILHGREDRVMPPDQARTLATLLPAARLEWIEGAGHDAVLRAPHIAVRAARDLLRESSP